MSNTTSVPSGIFFKVMKKEFRLRRHEDFLNVMHKGKKVKGNGVTVFALKNDLGKAQYGIMTTKKLGNAVTRVRVRRQVRAFLSIYNRYIISYDIVIIIRRDFLFRSSEDNKKELFKALDKLIEIK